MQDKYTIKRAKGKHLTLAERAKIEVYLKEGKNKAYIAEAIGASERIIYRGIRRNIFTMLPKGNTKKIRVESLDILKSAVTINWQISLRQ